MCPVKPLTKSEIFVSTINHIPFSHELLLNHGFPVQHFQGFENDIIFISIINLAQ